jgi:Domain of unknown function (DUF4145)
MQVLDVPLGHGGSDAEVVYPRTDATRFGLPETVARALDETLVALNGGAWNLAVTGFRTTLQLAVRDKGAKGRNLREEIEQLAGDGSIPASLKEWAHDIRAAGNDTAHPDQDLPFGEQDAQELLALTQSILDYLFVVPARVEDRRTRLAKEAAASATAPGA